MDNEFLNPTLSNKEIRRRSFTPNVSSYQEFLDFLYDDIDFVIDRLSRHRDKYSEGMRTNPKQGEDLINSTICDILTGRGWEAEHDTHINGNADIVVSIKYEPYEWIGEAKIRSGNKNLDKGIKQLIHRYSTGRDYQTSGGMIIYVKDSDVKAKKMLDDWKSYLLKPDLNIVNKEGLPTLLPPALRVEKCPEKQLVFYSYHEHPSSGLEYTVRHTIIDFRHDPLE